MQPSTCIQTALPQAAGSGSGSGSGARDLGDPQHANGPPPLLPLLPRLEERRPRGELRGEAPPPICESRTGGCAGAMLRSK